MSTRRIEPRMRVRDADLRKLVHQYGTGPGTPLHEALAELQARRDTDSGRSSYPHPAHCSRQRFKSSTRKR